MTLTKETEMDIGKKPKIVGHFYPEPEEMMFYLYLPIYMPNKTMIIPDRLRRYDTLFEIALNDYGSIAGKYVYITAKTMFVAEGCPGNRPGWHIDGFGSGGDVNYIWANLNPTEFAEQDFFDISDNDKQSMVDIEAQIDPSKINTYSNHSVLRLDESVVHRVSEDVKTGLRSFVKITVSDHKFANSGNSINYAFDYDWVYSPRSMERNLDHG